MKMLPMGSVTYLINVVSQGAPPARALHDRPRTEPVTSPSNSRRWERGFE